MKMWSEQLCENEKIRFTKIKFRSGLDPHLGKGNK